jgi:hypothetical protein
MRFVHSGHKAAKNQVFTLIGAECDYIVTGVAAICHRNQGLIKLPIFWATIKDPSISGIPGVSGTPYEHVYPQESWISFAGSRAAARAKLSVHISRTANRRAIA